MVWVRECPKCGKQRVYNRDTGTCYECAQAPKEEEMEAHGAHEGGVNPNCPEPNGKWNRCLNCGTTKKITDDCHNCTRLNPYDPNVTIDALEAESESIIRAQARATELRAVYREAYMAVLPVCLREAHARDEDVQSTVREVGLYALETVRQWPAMMAELEKEIAK